MATIPGTTVSLGDKEFVVAPLTLGMLRNGLIDKLREYDELVAAGKQFEAMSLSGDIIVAALRRNYPESELPDEEIFNRLDLFNSPIAFRAVLGLSGLTSGEAVAATEVGTSGPSTNPSPPVMGGQ